MFYEIRINRTVRKVCHFTKLVVFHRLKRFIHKFFDGIIHFVRHTAHFKVKTAVFIGIIIPRSEDIFITVFCALRAGKICNVRVTGAVYNAFYFNRTSARFIFNHDIFNFSAVTHRTARRRAVHNFNALF